MFFLLAAAPVRSRRRLSLFSGECNVLSGAKKLPQLALQKAQLAFLSTSSKSQRFERRGPRLRPLLAGTTSPFLTSDSRAATVRCDELQLLTPKPYFSAARALQNEVGEREKTSTAAPTCEQLFLLGFLFQDSRHNPQTHTHILDCCTTSNGIAALYSRLLLHTTHLE